MGSMQLVPSEVASIGWLNIQTNLAFMSTDIPAAAVLLATGHRLPESFFMACHPNLTKSAALVHATI
jgi:hypothetical protein